MTELKGGADIADVVARLRDPACVVYRDGFGQPDLLREAADEIERLRSLSPQGTRSDEHSAVSRWRKKPVVIEAVQFMGGNEFDQCPDWWSAAFHRGTIARRTDGTASIVTLEGIIIAQPKDWIIRGIKGELYPCKPDIFAATYEPADNAPSPVPSNWRPIAEAPRDGTRIWACNPTRGHRGEVFWNGREWELVDALSGKPIGIGFYPAYWQPLPSPPPTEDAHASTERGEANPTPPEER